MIARARKPLVTKQEMINENCLHPLAIVLSPSRAVPTRMEREPFFRLKFNYGG